MQEIFCEQFGRWAPCSWRISTVVMQDSIDSDFLRKLGFKCEQHLEINLAQPLPCMTPLCAFQKSNAYISLCDQGCHCECSWVNFYSGEPYHPEPVSSPPWHIQWRCIPVFVRAQMFPWWWSVTSPAPECVSSKLSRQSCKEEWECHFHLNFMRTDSAFSAITRWGLGYSIWMPKSKHSHLPVCDSFYYWIQLCKKSPLHIKTQINLPPSDDSFKNVPALIKSFLVFPICLDDQVHLMSLTNSPFQPHSAALPNCRQDQAAVKVTSSGFRRPQLAF